MKAVLRYFCRTNATDLCEVIHLHLHDKLQHFCEGSDTWEAQSQSSSWANIPANSNVYNYETQDKRFGK